MVQWKAEIVIVYTDYLMQTKRLIHENFHQVDFFPSICRIAAKQDDPIRAYHQGLVQVATMDSRHNATTFSKR